MNFPKKLSNSIHSFRFVFFSTENFIELSYLVFLQSPVLSFSEVPQIRAEVQLPTADDIIAHLANRNNTNLTDVGFWFTSPRTNEKFLSLQDHHTFNSSNNGTTRKTKSDLTDNKTAFVFNGTVPSNPLISMLEDKLRPYILHFLDSVGRVWQLYLIKSILFRLLLLNYGFN